MAPETPPARRICVILNEGSGRTDQAQEAIAEVERLLKGHGEVRRITNGHDIEAAAERAVDEGFDTLVSAGGDGTIMTVAGVAARRGVTLGILPFGTFNFFARGLGLPEDPVEAARVLLTGAARDWPVAEVNGQIFLNNASLGIYPMILREREATYRRFGRRRIAAYWSVIKTFLRFRKPLRLTLQLPGGTRSLRTPLLFVARSAYQLRYFDLAGTDCVEDGRSAVFVAPDGSRWDLFRQTWRLVWHSMTRGEDFELQCLSDFTVEFERKSILVACDGEKFRMTSPLNFRVRPEPLRVIGPTRTSAEPQDRPERVPA